MGGLRDGLYVNGIQLDESGKPVDDLVGIQIPRSAEETNQDSLFLQRESDPQDAKRLARELLEAKTVSQEEYDAAEEALWEEKLSDSPTK